MPSPAPSPLHRRSKTPPTSAAARYLTEAHRPGRYRIGAWADGTTPVARGIHMFSRSRYQHVGLIRPTNGIVEATWPKVTDKGYLDPMDAQVEFFTFRPWTGWGDPHWQELDAAMTNEVDDRYGLREILGFVFLRSVGENQTWICSELLAYGVAEVCKRSQQPGSWLPWLDFEGLQARVGPAYMDPYDCVKSLALTPFTA